MSRTLTIRDTTMELILVISEIQGANLSRNVGKTGGVITFYLQSGREVPCWFSDDAGMYRAWETAGKALGQ